MKPVKVWRRNISLAVCSNPNCRRRPSYGDTVYKIGCSTNCRTRYLCASCAEQDVHVQQIEIQKPGRKSS